MGPVAKDHYWSLYKSDRKFKDNLKSPRKEGKSQDPRFTYLQSCSEFNVRPIAGMMISKAGDTSSLDFSNKQLCSKGMLQAVINSQSDRQPARQQVYVSA